MIFPPKKMYCGACLQDTGYTEDSFTHYVIPPQGVQCPHCQNVLIQPRQSFLHSRPNLAKLGFTKA